MNQLRYLLAAIFGVLVAALLIGSGVLPGAEGQPAVAAAAPTTTTEAPVVTTTTAAPTTTTTRQPFVTPTTQAPAAAPVRSKASLFRAILAHQGEGQIVDGATDDAIDGVGESTCDLARVAVDGYSFTLTETGVHAKVGDYTDSEFHSLVAASLVAYCPSEARRLFPSVRFPNVTF